MFEDRFLAAAERQGGGPPADSFGVVHDDVNVGAVQEADEVLAFDRVGAVRGDFDYAGCDE